MSERLVNGAIVDGRYSVKRRIGSGGMADVYCADDLQLGRQVALKVLYDRWAEDEEFRERFRREASSAAGLQHQNVVSIYDRGELDGTSYIAMEYVDGRTLKALVQQEGPLPPARAIALITQVLRAARFAHKRGVIHRDFKPQNVMVDADDRAKVTDFGIARAGASDMTQTGSIMGTAQYLSPEQAQGLPVSAQSDLYSIGITLFELLTGRVPFEGESAVAIALKQVSEVPPPPSSLNPAVTPALDAVVARALEKEPARRWADADEFIAALQAADASLPRAAGTRATVVAGGVPPVVALAAAPLPLPVTDGYVYPPAPLGPEEEPERGRRWWIALLVAVVVAAAVVAALLLTGTTQVSVPDVVGRSQSAAESTLRSRGFATEANPQTASARAGTVIRQRPAAASKVDKGATVTLTVSAGPAQTPVPDLAGQPRLASLAKLKDLGFQPEEQTRADPKVGQNRVIETTPPAGTRLDKGAKVTLVISSGPARTAVPSVVGQSQAAASTALTGAGFAPAVKEQERDGVDPGTVLAQDPTAGTLRSRGARVTITVAVAPKQVALPDVTGLSEADARRVLSRAGFTVRRRVRQSENPDDDGQVLAQDPAGAAKVAPGATVTITVGRFDKSQLIPTTPTTTTPPTGATAP